MALPFLWLMLQAASPHCDVEEIRNAKAMGEFASIDWSVAQCTKDGIKWCNSMHEKKRSMNQRYDNVF